MEFDKIILGGGIYGLYAALYCGRRGENVLLIEYENESCSRATYVNQARVHNGYHYPRSYSTAIKSAHYFDRFVKDFSFAIKHDFKQIYATSGALSWTNADQFEKFCNAAKIKCDRIDPRKYFINNICDGAFETQEYTFDAKMIRDYFSSEIEKYSNITIKYNARIQSVIRENGKFLIRFADSSTCCSEYVFNATYASLNQVNSLFGFDTYNIKYELCEMILCDVSSQLADVGITVMDGPFFSIMPFGKTGLHSLTSVTFTPHVASYTPLPSFPCQLGNETFCTSKQLGNCNLCKNKPNTAWPYMSSLARKYLRDDMKFTYKNSLFSIKPILRASEIDDSRPTVMRKYSSTPTYVSVLSGKINTIYDIEDVL